MADAKLTALTAASALAAADLFYVSQSAASRKATGTQLLALVGTTYVPLAGGTMTGALTIASGTLTASAPALNITQTWTAGATFTGLNLNITDTSSAASSLLMDLQVSGVSKFSVQKDGLLVRLGGANATIDSTGRLVVGNSTYDTSIGSLWTVVATTGALRASVRSYPLSFGTDVILLGDAAGVLALRNGTNAQTLRVYGTYTDSSNYERLSLSTTAGSGVTIAAETLGTGADNLHLVLQSAGTGLIKFSLNGAQRAYIDTDGYYTGIGVVGTGGKFILSDSLDLRMDPTLGVKWTASGGYSGTVDSGLMRGAAGQVDVTNGTAATYRDLKLRNLLNVEYHQMTEMTAPSAPATNSVRIYAEDNGSGKTRLMALFATGAAQQIAIEP